MNIVFLYIFFKKNIYNKIGTASKGCCVTWRLQTPRRSNGGQPSKNFCTSWLISRALLLVWQYVARGGCRSSSGGFSSWQSQRPYDRRRGCGACPGPSLRRCSSISRRLHFRRLRWRHGGSTQLGLQQSKSTHSRRVLHVTTIKGGLSSGSEGRKKRRCVPQSLQTDCT